MGEDKGWISLHRNIQDNWIWSEDSFDKAHAWLDLLLSANHKDNKVLIGNEFVVVKKGSFITSNLKLMKKFGWGKSKLRNFLAIISTDGMIKVNSTKQYTMITILNYELYQNQTTISSVIPKDSRDCQTADRPQTDHEQTTKQPQTDRETATNNNNIYILSKDNICSTEALQSVISEWNSLGISKLVSINPGTNRYKMLRTRIKNYGLNKILEAIKNINHSDFLKGQNNRNWTITFEWFIKPNNFIKVLENNYINKNIFPQASDVHDKYIET